MRPFAPELYRVWQAIKDNEVGSVAPEIYYRLKPEHRHDFVEAIGTLAMGLPKEEQATFFSNIRKTAPRQGRSMWDGLLQGVGNYLESELENSIPIGEWSKNTRDEMLANVREDRKALNFSADLQQWQEQYDPVKAVSSNFVLQNLELGIYQAPSAIGYMAIAAIPYAGPALSYNIATGQSYADYRSRFMAAGMTDEQASAEADKLAPIVGAITTVTDVLGAKAFKGAFPFADRYLTGLTNRITNVPARFAVRGLLIQAEEQGMENVQAWSGHIVQALAKATGAPIPGVELTNGKDGVFDGFWATQIQLVGSLGPLSMFGAAQSVRADMRAMAWNRASDTQLTAILGSKSAVDHYRTAARGGLTSAVEAMDHTMRHANPRSDEAKAAVQELLANSEELRKSQASGLVPVLVSRKGAIDVFDPVSNKLIGRGSNIEEALRIAKGHIEENDQVNRDRVAQMADAVDRSNKPRDETHTSVSDENLKQTHEAVEEATQPFADDQSVAAQAVAEEMLDGGDGNVTRSVMGNSLADLRNRLQSVTNRILSGTNVREAAYQSIRELAARSLESGNLTPQEVSSYLQTADQQRGNSNNQERRNSSILPKGEITTSSLTDAFAHYVISKALGSQQTGTSLPFTGEESTTSPMAEPSPEAVRKITAFTKASSQLLGLALSKTLNVRQGGIDAPTAHKLHSAPGRPVPSIDSPFDFDDSPYSISAAHAIRKGNGTDMHFSQAEFAEAILSNPLAKRSYEVLQRNGIHVETYRQVNNESGGGVDVINGEWIARINLAYAPTIHEVLAVVIHEAKHIRFLEKTDNPYGRRGRKKGEYAARAIEHFHLEGKRPTAAERENIREIIKNLRVY